MKKPIVFSDVDGTLYEKDCYVSNFNLEILRRPDICFNIATGNPICPRMKKLAKLTEVDYVIGSSGTQIYDFQKDKIIHEEYLDPKIVKKVFELIQKYKISAGAWSSKIFYKFREEDNEFLNMIYYRYENFDQFTLYKAGDKILPICKIEVYFENTPNVDQFQAELDKLGIRYLRTHMNLEIIKEGWSKGKAILWMLDNIFAESRADEIMVIGDSENDNSMFRRFHYAYAMDNAKDEVKSRATFVTKGVGEHGLGIAILDYLSKLNAEENKK